MHTSTNYLSAAVVCRGYRDEIQYVPESARDTKNPHIRPRYLPKLPVLVPYAAGAVSATDRLAAVKILTKKSIAVVYSTFNFGHYSFTKKNAPCFFSKDFLMRELKTDTGFDVSLLQDLYIIISYGTITSKSYYGITFNCMPNYDYPNSKTIVEIITVASKSIIESVGDSTNEGDLASVGVLRIGSFLVDLIRSAHMQQQWEHHDRISWGEYRSLACEISVEASEPMLVRFGGDYFGPTTDLWLS